MALNLDSYGKTQWEPKMPITQGRMDNLEDGVYVNREAIKSLDATTTSQENAITTLNTNVNTKLNQEQVDNRIILQLSGITSDTENGRKAWIAITNATTNNAPAYPGLSERFGANETLIANLRAALGQIRNSDTGELQDIYTSDNTVANTLVNLSETVRAINEEIAASLGRNPSTGIPNTQFRQHMSQIDNAIQSLNQSMLTIFESTGIDENNQPIAMSIRMAQLVALNEEIAAAHRAVEEGASPDTLAKRFGDIESAISSLRDNKVNIADIIDDLVHNDSNKPLSANMGKTLKDTIGGTYSPASTVASAIATAQSTAENNAESYADTNKIDKTKIYNGLDYETQEPDVKEHSVLDALQGKALKDLIEDLDSSTDTRLDTIETELNDARIEIGTDEESGDPVMSTLDQRLDAMDTTAAGIRADLTTVISELGMTDTNGLKTMGTRIDDLADNVAALATELDMQMSEDKIVDTNSRIDSIETVIDHVQGENDEVPNGLKQRISSLESNLDTAENNITELDQRLTTLQNEPKSATEIVVSLPQVGDPNKDYLLGPNEDGKYFYYKWIVDGAESNWKLISGGGGSGTGSSSGVIAETLPDIDKADENIDYYIGNSISGYTHYRYIPSSTANETGNFVAILPKNIIGNIGVTTVTTTNSYSETDAWPDNSTISGGLEAYELNDTQHNTNLLNDFVAVRNTRINAVYDGDELKSQTLQVLDTKGHLIEYPIVGGGGGNAYSIRFLSTLPNNTFTVPQDSTYHTYVKAKAIVKQGSDLLTGVSFSGEVQYQLPSDNESTWHRSNIIFPSIRNDQEFSIEVSSLLVSNATTKIRLLLVINTGDGEPVTRTVDYSITKTQISISSTFDPSVILTSANLVIHYTPQGVGLDKTVYFKIDGEDAITPINTSAHNTELDASISLLGLTEGAHKLQIYFTTNGNIFSNKLNYYIIYSLTQSGNTPIIGLNTAQESIIDGEELIVNYTVYTPGQETTEKIEIKLYTIDDNNVPTLYNEHVDVLTDVPVRASTWRTVNYPTPITPEEGEPETPVKVQVAITAYNTVMSTDADQQPIEIVYTSTETTEVIINRFTNEQGYDFTEVATNNLLYSYVPYGKSNNDIDRDHHTYEYTANDSNATKITFNGEFTGFNWATNGYMNDGSLTISGGAKYNIDVPIFASSYNIGTAEEPNNVTIEYQSAQDITQYGRTIIIDYEVRSATDLNATIIDCIDDSTHAGFRVTPNYCYLTNKTTPAEVDKKDGFILNESSIAAAYLQTNTRIHLAFVIEPWSNEKAYDKTYHQTVNIYINGEFANSCPYERDTDGRIIDDFSSLATMSLGSDTCILKVYGIKIYNRGLNDNQILQAYKLAPNLLNEKLVRFENNDVLTNGEVNYEKAKRRFNCLLLKGPDPTDPATLDWPTISPFKGSVSPAHRKKKATDVDYEGKTESGLIFTKPSTDPTTDGYVEEFNLCDKIPVGAPAYLGAAGAYCSSNNVQGTSSQKYPLHNLKVYLAKWQAEKTTTKNVALNPGEQVEDGVETVEIDGTTYKVVTETTPAQIKKVKYSLKGYNDDGTPKGIEESTLCWKADFMSTDHANTYNANIADDLFSDELQPNWKDQHLQNTVYGVRCMLFVQQGDNAPIKFVGDGCLNNDKGNTKTFGLEDKNDDGNNTLRQKWEFTNNTSPLDTFKSDNLFAINEKDSKKKIFAKGAFECNYPDEGDLKDDDLEPNYNHLQLLLTWVNKRACYLDYSVYDDTDGSHVDYTVSDIAGSGGTYKGIEYNTERELKKAIFRNEFEDHFNLNHVLTYYLFSEYVALCDNRAKNMFLRSEDIRSEVIYNVNGQKILDGNSYPDDDGTLWNDFVDTSTGITNPSLINWDTTGTNHSTFAKWAPVLYDLDSCFGVENVGLITIKYNADWQYQYNGKEAFSGFDSIFWLMVEDTYASELATLATQLYNNELNFTNFYRQQITGNKNATCPAITNQDMILKYQKPWNEGFINYAESPDPVTGLYPTQTPLYKYIQRGTRATQKTTFMRQRSMLLSSKYVSTEFTNSMISFRAGVLVTGDNTLLQLVANQDLYPAIMFGDSNTLVRPSYIIENNERVEIDRTGYVTAGTPCQIITSQIGNSDTVKIVGASVLNDIGDLSKYQPYELKVGSGTNLKRLIVGSNAPGYINTSTESIEGLSECELLEEINVRNLTKISSLNLGGNGLIKKVYAGGSNITTISLPNGGVLEEIEYGDNTTNITILNQKSLTSFVYNNPTPTVNNIGLTKLWIENTPNVPIVELINTRIDNLRNGIRLVGIDIDLDNDPTFLEKIVSKLAIGKYITSNGTMPSDNKDYPTITGKVKIHTIRKSLFNLLKAHYPDLEIDYDQDGLVDEYSINYVDWNGKILYTLNGTANEYYIDPAVDTDPITGEPYITPWPTRNPTAEYYYYFGSYNTEDTVYTPANYIKYSGWVKEYANGVITPLTSGQIEGNNIARIRAVYDTTEQRMYTISWYKTVNDETPITSTRSLYGTDISSAVTWPDEKGLLAPCEMVNNSYYRVFTGWDNPGGELTSDIRINAQWETSNVSSATSPQDFDLSNLTAADLYALSQVQPATRTTLLASNLSPEKTITLQMGHDFNFTNITTYNLLENNEEIVFNGGENAITFNGNGHQAIYPFTKVFNSETNEYEYQDFTLALDYQITMNTSASSDEYILASCYSNQNATKNGFKLALRPDQGNSNMEPIILTWGADDLLSADTYEIVDYRKIINDGTQYSKNYRNMIVLSFSKKTPRKITVYYSGFYTNQGVSSPDQYDNEIKVATLTYDSNLDENTPLILGQSANYRLYWGKFWQANIGSNNCVKLATWPHEKVHCYLTGYDGASTELTNPKVIDNTKLTFVTAEVVGDRLYNANFSNTNANPYGWHTMPTKAFYNGRLYQGLSTAYQSVITATTIKSNTSNNNAQGNVVIETTNDNYLFLPSEREINLQTSSTEALRSWPWLTTQLENNGDYILNVYKFRSTSTTLVKQSTLDNLNLYRCRFKDYYISKNTNIFITTQTPYNNGNSWTIYDSDSRVTLSDGDIWVNIDANNQIQNVYVYVSKSKVNTGAYVDVIITRSNGIMDGGWRLGDFWQLRTYDTNQNGSNPQWRYFNQINRKGGIDYGGSTSSGDYGLYKGIIFEFAI